MNFDKMGKYKKLGYGIFFDALGYVSFIFPPFDIIWAPTAGYLMTKIYKGRTGKIAGIITDSETILFFISILVVATGVYAARSLYFAVMERGQIPLVLTGTAVGLISLIGYTPDIFAGPAMGYLLENSPGAEGHQHVFWMLALFSFVGGIASWYYFRLYSDNKRC